MAGDWIKIEHALPGKPEVMSMAAELGISDMEVVGHLVCFWTWVDLNLSRECHAVRVTEKSIDRVAGVTGFANAMIDVGWLSIEDGILTIPNYDEHLSKSAKSRALALKRKKRQRENVTPDGTELSRSQRDKNETESGLEKRDREETNKERKNKKKESPGYSSEFESFWDACTKKESKGAAWKAWPKALKFAASSEKKFADESVAEFLTRRMRDYSSFVSNKDRQYIKLPGTWLNQACWDDEIGSRVATEEDMKTWTAS